MGWGWWMHMDSWRHMYLEVSRPILTSLRIPPYLLSRCFLHLVDLCRGSVQSLRIIVTQNLKSMTLTRARLVPVDCSNRYRTTFCHVSQMSFLPLFASHGTPSHCSPRLCLRILHMLVHHTACLSSSHVQTIPLSFPPFSNESHRTQLPVTSIVHSSILQDPVIRDLSGVSLCP